MMSIISQEFPDFEDSIKIIKTYEYKEKVELDASNVNVKRDPFIIYVSGISSDDGEDTKLASKALSDVNILAVINPETKQVLLVTTPRDSYMTSLHMQVLMVSINLSKPLKICTELILTIM